VCDALTGLTAPSVCQGPFPTPHSCEQHPHKQPHLRTWRNMTRCRCLTTARLSFESTKSNKKTLRAQKATPEALCEPDGAYMRPGMAEPGPPPATASGCCTHWSTHVISNLSPSMSRCVSNFVPTRTGSKALPSFTADFVPAAHRTPQLVAPLSHLLPGVDQPARWGWGHR
jgi:hypothetical protein